MKGFLGKSSLQYYNLSGRVKHEIQLMANTLYNIENNNLSSILTDPGDLILTTQNSSGITPDTSKSAEEIEFE